MIDSLSRLWTDQIFLSVRLPSSSEFLFCWTPKHRNVRIIPSVPHTSSENFSTLELLFVHINPCPLLPSNQTANMRRYMARALMAPAMGTVPTQARIMFLKSFQSTFCLDLTRPTDTTEPTLQWVVLIGIPTLDARRTVKAEPTSMQNPLKTKHNFVIINWSLPRA